MGTRSGVAESGNGLLGARAVGIGRLRAPARKTFGETASDDRRRTQRVVIRIAVALHRVPAQSPAAKPIRAHTVAVNDQGAMLLAEGTLDPQAALELENERTGQRVACRITRAPRQMPDGFLVPVEFSAAVPGFWNIAFPPDDWKVIAD